MANDPLQKAYLEAELERAKRHPLDRILAREEHRGLREAWERNEETASALMSAVQRCWIASNVFELAGAVEFVARNLGPWAEERRMLRELLVKVMVYDSTPWDVIVQDPRLEGYRA